MSTPCFATISRMDPGEKLKTLRTLSAPKSTQADLAESIGLGLNVVRNWELGRTALPKGAAMKIAEMYNIDWRWFFRDDDSLPEQTVTIDTSDEAAKLIAGFAQTVAVRSYIGVLAGLDNEEAYFQEEGMPFEIPVGLPCGRHCQPRTARDPEGCRAASRLRKALEVDEDDHLAVLPWQGSESSAHSHAG